MRLPFTAAHKQQNVFINISLFEVTSLSVFLPSQGSEFVSWFGWAVSSPQNIAQTVWTDSFSELGV